jgi:NTP pyrophosphatase (non-canonical NTP hydrolase)
MNLSEIQITFEKFLKERFWDRFAASQIFTHLIEELGEISRYISISEGYKLVGLGHDVPSEDNLSREFAQAFNLFLQLAIHFDVDLESSFLSEIERMKERFPADRWRDALANKK